ncbi:MAG TPA: ABC transporter substrate-binding protein [Terriglobales bacterium]|jgi:NitT/TauT family transport system substrate-binding protein|nr:ABC transporter substrate-binding protein [Terriglobales bacterium]
MRETRHYGSFVREASAYLGLLLVAATPAFALDTIRVSYATLSAAYMDHICAMDKGYLKEEGLNVEVIRAPGGVATPGLLSGQFQFSSSASSSLSAGVRGGPVKIIYTNLSRPTYSLVAIKPDIASAKDLVGKKIAINSFGDTGHLSTILYLKKMRVNPTSVLFIAVGRNEVRFPALLSGAIDAAPLTVRDLVALKDQKHVVLANLGKEIQLVWNGVSTSNKLLAENPNLVERFLRALAKGREFARRYRDETIGFVSKRDPTPIDAIKVDYEATKASMTEDGSLPDDVLRDEVATRAEITKVANPPDISAVFDYSIIRKIYAQLKSSGWQPAR